MNSENQNPILAKLRSLFSISLFIILVIGVSFLTWNFIQAAIEKFAG